MMSNNKILTVSYGTFSCTLEGFDDSFDTMKAIAEYFRDLAADDRYFGAEPPQPDAEMLARIAEREIARRVEAHLSEDGIHLRAGKPTVAVAPDAAGDAQTTAADDHASTPQTDVANEPEAARIVAQAVSPLTVQASQSYTMVSMSATLPPAAGYHQSADAGNSAPEDVAPIDDSILEGALADDTAAQFFAQRAQKSSPLHAVAEDLPAVARKPAPNSIADKLQRIRAVVSKSYEVPAAYSEDEHADAILEEQPAERALATEFLSPRTEDVTEHAASGTCEEDEDAELAATLARLSDEFAAPPMMQQRALPDISGNAEPSASQTRTAGTGAQDEDLDDESDSGHDVTGQYDYEAALAAVTEAEVEVDTTPAVRARVIRVKRSDLEAALNAGLLEAAEADLDPTEDQDTDASTARLLEEVAAEEEELDRLMAQADRQMDEPESTSRRAAFDQMRGAVAATLDDTGLNSEDDTDEHEYRSDLAAAVTPRRPVATGRTDRPRDQRPAPLKLVAEQRIDTPLARSGPVRPRRVAASLQASGADDSFGNYAAARGAHELPDLLEAAAAYLTFVEGREQFSRPQLMSKVRQIDPDMFSREDGLRQFGMLLRSGKIEKINGGRFTVSDGIGFRPDGERAAG